MFSTVNKPAERVDAYEKVTGRAKYGADLQFAGMLYGKVLSVAEGNDKPAKYPLVFRESQVVLINSIDLLPHTDCDIDQLESDLKLINHGLKLFRVSARLDQGFEPWVQWLEEQVNLKKKLSAGQ